MALCALASWGLRLCGGCCPRPSGCPSRGHAPPMGQPQSLPHCGAPTRTRQIEASPGGGEREGRVLSSMAKRTLQRETVAAECIAEWAAQARDALLGTGHALPFPCSVINIICPLTHPVAGCLPTECTTRGCMRASGRRLAAGELHAQQGGTGSTTESQQVVVGTAGLHASWLVAFRGPLPF